MNTNEKVTATGVVQVLITAPDGSVKHEQTIPNMVVTSGLGYIASRMKDATATAMSHMAIGSGTTAAALGQTALVTESARVALTSTTVTANAVAYVVVDPTAEYKVAVTTSGAPTVVTGANATIVGCNVAEIQNGTGSSATGDAQSSIVKPADTAGTATTLPWRVVAVVPDTAYVSGGVTIYPEVIVKVNNPQLTALTGTAYAA